MNHQYQPVQGDPVAGTGMETVTITKAEYIQLVSISHQFENLTRSLLQGGMPRKTLDALVRSPVPFPLVPQQLFEINPELFRSQEELPFPQGNGLLSQEHGLQLQKHELQALGHEQHPQPLPRPIENRMRSAPWDELASPNGGPGPMADDLLVLGHDEKDVVDSATAGSTSTKEGTVRRIVKISHLPERVTLRDVINEIRGGALAEVQRKANDSINVAFAESSAALNFYKHVQRYGLYILGKKVTVEWSEQQFPLSQFVKQKIQHGASRILVLCNINTNIATAPIFREHLDHIHNLEIVNIECRQSKVIIRTNSVHKAIFARNCMMSRYEYRGVRIEFGFDECMMPLIPPPRKRPQPVVSKAKHSSKMLPSNRYELLNGLDDE